MVRLVVAGVLGAVVYYVWGMLAWMALPIHGPTVHQLPDEAAITEALQSQNLESAVYIAPMPDADEDFSDPDAEFTQRHLAGPVYSIFYHRDGLQPMSPGVLATGFVIDLLAALIAACMLTSVAGGCCRGYAARVGFVAGLGVFVALIGHVAYWNWMHFPLGYTIAFCVDVTVGWTLAGLVMAALIRPEAEGAQPVEKAGTGGA